MLVRGSISAPGLLLRHVPEIKSGWRVGWSTLGKIRPGADKCSALKAGFWQVAPQWLQGRFRDAPAAER